MLILSFISQLDNPETSLAFHPSSCFFFLKEARHRLRYYAMTLRTKLAARKRVHVSSRVPLTRLIFTISPKWRACTQASVKRSLTVLVNHGEWLIQEVKISSSTFPSDNVLDICHLLNVNSLGTIHACLTVFFSTMETIE